MELNILDKWILKCESLEDKNRILREALEFYAGRFPNDDLNNWQERICEDEGDEIDPSNRIIHIMKLIIKNKGKKVLV